ncbi:MAG: hypothetical protein IPK60_10540 [Sandaracinaceae bacterium]|nr:hypothetical protein [Sandaracinaceae bacterium]
MTATNSKTLASILGLCIAFTACGGEPTPETDGGGLDAGALDAGRDASFDASADSGADSGADAGADAGPDAGACVDPPTGVPFPADVASTQTVTFHVSGTGYLSTQGSIAGCSPFGVQQAGADIPLRGAYECLCECPPPPADVAAQVVLLGDYDLTWDARRLLSYTTAWDCSTHGWPGGGCQRDRHDVFQPVEAGHYNARFGIHDELPAGCSEGEAGVYSCFSAGPGVIPTSGICPADRFIEVEFDLPASGNVDVNVTIPAAS